MTPLARALVPTAPGNRTLPRIGESPRDAAWRAIRLCADTIAAIVEEHAGIIEGEPELDGARSELAGLGDALYVLAERATEAVGMRGADREDPSADTRGKDRLIDERAA